MKDKRQANFIADLIASSVAPALVMGMIYCLISFLILVFYRDGFQTRVNYIFALYIFASVLIARIAIEQGRTYSLGYTAALGLATFVVIGRFVVFHGPLAALSPVINIGLLALVGYLADRIVFDCTLVESDRDTSGEGLLQSLGLVRSEIAKQQTKNIASQPQKRKRKHNPGVTILYFALLAIPLFGIGQLFLPGGNEAVRRSALYLLCGYFLTSFSLLVTTSFLGLRRYLNQRGVDVPTRFTATWLTMGLVGTIVFLTISLFLPLPGRELGLFDLPFQIRAIEGLAANRFGWGNEGIPDNQSTANAVNPSAEGSATDGMSNTNDNNSSSGAMSSDQASSSGANSSDSSSALSSGSESSGNGSASGGTQQGNSQSDASTGSSSGNDGSKRGGGSNANQPGGSESRGNKADASTAGNSNGESSENSRPTAGSNSASSPSQGNESSDNSKDSANSPSGNESENMSQSRSTDNTNRANQVPPKSGEAESDSSQTSERSSKSSAENADRNSNQTSSGQSESPGAQTEKPTANSSDQEVAQDSSASTEPNSPEATSNFNFDLGSTFAALFKWITIGVLLLIVIYYVLTHRDELRKLLAEFRAWWNKLWGIEEDDSLPADLRDQVKQPAQRRKFSSFANPFSRRGGVKEMSELIRYTFAALEAWGAERGVVREEEQTAEEYLKRLVAHLPRCQDELYALASAYGRLAYAGGRNISLDVNIVQKIWLVMEQYAVAPTVTSTISTA